MSNHAMCLCKWLVLFGKPGLGGGNFKGKVLVVAIFFAMACPVSAAVTKLHIAIGSGYPPFYFFDENRQPVGICIDIVNQVAQAMDIMVHYESYPWKRMLKYGKEGRVDAVMPLFKTSEREQFLIFPATGLVDEDNSFFTARSSSIAYSGDLAAVIDRKIGVVDKYSYGKEFDNTNFSNKLIVQNVEQLIQRVQLGRVELGTGNSKVVSYFASKMGVADKIRFLSPQVTVSPLFIGFSRQRVEQDFVDQFSRQLQEFRATKAYADLVQAYGH